MESSAGVKVTGIRQIVRLKEILHKWQMVSLGSSSPPMGMGGSPKSNSGGISPAINKRLANLMSSSCGGDSDEDVSCSSPEPPPDVPKGYLAVYVGPELRRFIIPTAYLSHSLFKVLLEKAEEEFGFDHNNALTIPCEIETFKFLLKCIEKHQNQNEQQIVPAGGEAGRSVTDED